jgi:hypothetical protein
MHNIDYETWGAYSDVKFWYVDHGTEVLAKQVSTSMLKLICDQGRMKWKVNELCTLDTKILSLYKKTIITIYNS